MKRVITFFIISALIWPLFSIGATTQEEIDARNEQIEEIQRQIDAYQMQIDENGAKARTLSVEISRLNAQANLISKTADIFCLKIPDNKLKRLAPLSRRHRAFGG